MIYNENQRRVSVQKLTELKTAYGKQSKSSHPLKEAHLASIEGLINDIEAEVNEYDLLKSGRLSFKKYAALSDLPKALIAARISQGISQTNLANLIGVKPQQIQRYEATYYQGANLARLIEISQSLDVSISENWQGKEKSAAAGTIFSWETPEEIQWDRFPAKEMLSRGWLKLKSKDNLLNAVRDFFLRSAGPEFATAIHRKKFFGGNEPNEFSLLAWQARILEKAENEISDGIICEFALDDSWIDTLRGLSTSEDGPVRAKHFLAQKGIVLVVEEHLKGTYLDGAAMVSKSGFPVIGLTLRYDRLDNFWFVLFHELGHVFLHLFHNFGLDFFDEDDGVEADAMEEEANSYALGKLLSEEDWKKCASRFMTNSKNVIQDSRRLGIHHSIVAGRIRKAQNDYTTLTDLVGQGCVKTMFKEYL